MFRNAWGIKRNQIGQRRPVDDPVRLLGKGPGPSELPRRAELVEKSSSLSSNFTGRSRIISTVVPLASTASGPRENNTAANPAAAPAAAPIPAPIPVCPLASPISPPALAPTL